MRPASLFAGLPMLGLALSRLSLGAADLFVSPSGTPFGTGTYSNPVDVETAFSGGLGEPGDTFWLKGGDYHLGHLDTNVHGAPGAPVTFRQALGEIARIDGSLTIYNSQGYVVFRDFELYSSDTNRMSSQVGMGFNVTDISIIPGIACYSPNVSLINLIVHDQTRHGIYTSETASNVLVYGCVLYNNGWVSPDNAEGHGIYIQGEDNLRTLKDSILFNNSGVNVHVYENSPGKPLVGVNVEGNVAFQAGGIQRVRIYRDWIVGVDYPGSYADKIVLKDNMGFVGPATTQSEAQFGRDSTNGDIVIQGNYWPLGLAVNNWQTATVTGNVLAPQFTATCVVALNRTLCPLEATWDDNTYVCAPGGNQAMLNNVGCDFTTWQNGTGFDLGSTFVTGSLLGTRIYIRPNAYEPGRANIIVYNWNYQANVAVDVRSVLSVGTPFEVRNVQDYTAEPVLAGVFQGQPLLLPTTNLTVAAPTGPLVTPPPTGLIFNVFVLLPRYGLQIERLEGAVQVWWPFTAGENALQYRDSVYSDNPWTNCSTIPTLVGDRYTITETTGAAMRFYRLHNSL